MFFKILDFPFVLQSGFSGGECPEIPSFSRFRVYFPRVESIFPRFKFSKHKNPLAYGVGVGTTGPGVKTPIPKTKAMINKIKNMKNNSLDISTDTAATPGRPSNPATSAITKNIIAQVNIMTSFFYSYLYPSYDVNKYLKIFIDN